VAVAAAPLPSALLVVALLLLLLPPTGAVPPRMDVALLPQSAPGSAAPPVDVALLRVPRRRLRVQVVIAVPRINAALLV